MGNKIWTTENGSVVSVDGKLRPLADRNIANYLTGNGHARGPWLQGFREMLLGVEDHPIKISRGIKPADGIGEVGDIVYNTNPQVGGYIGWVCTALGREWTPFGKIEA